MKIMLTGANGFIGKRFLKKASDIFGVDNIVALTSRKIPDYNCLIYTSENFSVNDFKGFDFSSVNVILHAGAFIPKSGAVANDIASCNGNVTYTENLLKLPLPNLDKFIYLSTVDVYGSDEVVSENTRVEPVSLYGASKLYCEEMVKAYGKNNKIDVQILRIGHVYGPGEEQYSKIIPVTIKNILRNSMAEVWGDGEELRSFIYVDDLIRVLISAVESKIDISPINVVSGRQVTILGIIKEIIEVSGKNVVIKFKESDHTKRDLTFDNSLLKQTLLDSEIELIDGLKKEYEYMKENECYL